MNATYKGAAKTFIPGETYPLVFGVCAAGYSVKYSHHQPIVYKSLRAFSEQWDIITYENTVKASYVPKIDV